jgi:SRF-type transcription factor (DNA-binding and dimerisation domain)
MADQTKKERNTQRRKRKGGFENKAYEMWDLCGFQMLTVMENPETGEFYTFRTMKKLSWNIDQIVSELTQVIFTH